MISSPGRLGVIEIGFENVIKVSDEFVAELLGEQPHEDPKGIYYEGGFGATGGGKAFGSFLQALACSQATGEIAFDMSRHVGKRWVRFGFIPIAL